jgi:predicted DNA-binding antitoxin AbrB/MazE fold protein
MTITLEAVYEDGVLRLSAALLLPAQTRVLVTIRSADTAEERERAAWLRLSEENLSRIWDNTADDVFNELLSK